VTITGHSACAPVDVAYAPCIVTAPLLGMRSTATELVELEVSRFQLCHRLPSQPEECAGESWNAPAEASNSHAFVDVALSPAIETWTSSHGRNLRSAPRAPRCDALVRDVSSRR
jgi:hypothetical protein